MIFEILLDWLYKNDITTIVGIIFFLIICIIIFTYKTELEKDKIEYKKWKKRNKKK